MRIKQIIPAPVGTYAVFEGKENAVNRVPVICWALFEDEDDDGFTHVEGLALWAGDGEISRAEVCDNFLTYEFPISHA